MTEDERAIRALVSTWMAASRAGDTETVLSLMADDVVFMVPGAEPFGKEAFAAKWGFPVTGIARHLQAQSVQKDWMFNVIRTKNAVDMEKLRTGLGLKKGPKSPIGEKEYFSVTAELDSFARFWFTTSFPYTTPPRNKPLGLHKIDETTLIVAELDPLEKFLQKAPEIAKTPEAPPPPGGQPSSRYKYRIRRQKR